MRQYQQNPSNPHSEQQIVTKTFEDLTNRKKKNSWYRVIGGVSRRCRLADLVTPFQYIKAAD